MRPDAKSSSGIDFGGCMKRMFHIPVALVGMGQLNLVLLVSL